jgi:tetratricopeptide (TPR) repeat protein
MKTWLFTILVFLLLTTPVNPQTQSQGSSSVKPVASDPTTPAPELAEAEALNSQVMSLYHAGYYKEAVPLANRVLLLREKILGPDHRLVAEALRNLSELFSAMGKSKEAMTAYQRYLTVFEKSIDAYGPELIAVLNRYVCLLLDDGGKAAQRDTALEIQKRLFRIENGFDFDESDNLPVKRLATGGLLINKRRKSASPHFPRDIMNSRLSGLMIVKVKVDELGNVISARRVCGYPGFAQAAEEASLKAKYAPTLVSGKPVKVAGLAIYEFWAEY